MPVLCLNNFYHGDQVRALYLGAEAGVTRQYKELIGRYQAIRSSGTKPSISRKIRTDPAARVTDLLKEVFGK